jgi:hypothetical protein
MKRKAQVVMLPTDKVSDIFNVNKHKLVYVPSDDTEYTQVFNDRFQHLYFTTDDKIKDGDWCLFFWDGLNGNLRQIGSEPQRYFPENGHTFNRNLRKIIATTDPELTGITKEWEEFEGDWHKSNKLGLPQPSKAFIDKYCKEGGIDEVEVEYERSTIGGHGMTLDGEFGFIYDNPKVDSHNTITIHPIKDSYSKEELIQFVLDNRFKIDSDTTREDVEQWI